MRFFAISALLFVLICLPVIASSNDEQKREEVTLVSSLETDRDNDGTIDYLLGFDESGKKIYEELDFNYDGKMDDFYYYTSGVLIRREIDTNYDSKVDVWVYIHEGVYIERYERDLDYDGEIDQIKDFSAVEKENQ